VVTAGYLCATTGKVGTLAEEAEDHNAGQTADANEIDRFVDLNAGQSCEGFT
jgi:hypothetical protein